MIQRTRIIPVEPMAWRLALRPAADRAAAIEAMKGEFCLEDILDGIDAARARAGELVAAAASDAPWAVGLGALRDALACGVIAGLAAYGWLVFA